MSNFNYTSISIARSVTFFCTVASNNTTGSTCALNIEGKGEIEDVRVNIPTVMCCCKITIHNMT